MTSSYRGIYAHKHADGTIYEIQCVDATGAGVTLALSAYRQHGVQPEPESLPDQNRYANDLKIREIALTAIYPAAAAIFGRPTGHPHSQVDMETISMAVDYVTRFGGKVEKKPLVRGNPNLGELPMVWDGSGNAIPNNVRVF
jgi:hypothetical protein